MSDNDQQNKARTEQEAEREFQRTRLRQEKAIQDVFDASTIRFKQAPAQVLRGVTGKVVFNADGIPMTDSGLTLADAIVQYGKVNPMTVAQTIAEVHDGGKSHIRSKDQLRTPREVSDFINANSGDAYNRLPLHAPEPVNEETMEFAEYKKLPYERKKALADKHGWGFAAKLQRRESERIAAQRLAGVPDSKIKR